MTDDNFISPYQKPGRSLDGKFLPGHSATPGAGRKPATYESALTNVRKVAEEIMAGRFSEEKWGTLLDDLWDRALDKKEKWATERLFEYYGPQHQGGALMRQVPDGILITPVSGDYRDAMRSILPMDEDEDGES